MKQKDYNNLGSLIDLSQIRDGEKIEELLKNFDKLDNEVRYKIKISLEKKINDLIQKYKALQGIIQDDLNGFEELYSSLSSRIDEHNVYSEDTYVKKGKVSLQDLDDDLKEKIYKLLSGNQESMPDKDNNMQTVSWSLYFTMYGYNMAYIDDVKNKSLTSNAKSLSFAEWAGKDYKNGNYDSDVELWIYDEPSQFYLPLEKGYVKVSGDATFNSNTRYYTKNDDDVYIFWNDEANFENDQSQLYYFDVTNYENALIDVLEGNKFDMTYVPKKLRIGEDENGNQLYYTESGEKPVCGNVVYSAGGRYFRFEKTALTRYVFKLVKYL